MVYCGFVVDVCGWVFCCVVCFGLLFVCCCLLFVGFRCGLLLTLLAAGFVVNSVGHGDLLLLGVCCLWVYCDLCLGLLGYLWFGCVFCFVTLFYLSGVCVGFGLFVSIVMICCCF